MDTPGDGRRSSGAGRSLGRRFRRVRAATLDLVAPLEVEDLVPASHPNASSAKWHLGHTTWWFERYFLEPHLRGFAPDPEWRDLFDPGRRGFRTDRGVWSRPTAAEVGDYRRRVEDKIGRALEAGLGSNAEAALRFGIQHEALHQELLLADLKHLFGTHPLRPAYRADGEPDGFEDAPPPLRFLSFAGGEVRIGRFGTDSGFGNETPRHRRFLEPFGLANRLVTNGEYREFIEEGGYRERSLWLPDGWDACVAEGWRAPLYWENPHDGPGTEFTLLGPRPIEPAAPVSHVSYFEADAFARWRECRLPGEAEWETAAAGLRVEGNFAESGRLVPRPASRDRAGVAAPGPAQMFGDLWEWTRSPHGPYPGYRTADRQPGDPTTGFATGRQVLRGGSCLAPELLVRETTRNFLRPRTRLLPTGIRLARDRTH